MQSIGARYQIAVKDQAGAKVSIFDTFLGLSYNHKVNDVGSFELTFYDDEDPRFELFELDGKVEIVRSIPGVGLDWYTEFTGLFRRKTRSIDPSGNRTIKFSGFCPNHLLTRRVIGYRTGTVQATKDEDYAEDIIKEIVTENLGSGATVANGRVRDGVFANFLVDAESASHALTPIWGGEVEFRPLLETIREIANFSASVAVPPTTYPIDFRVLPTGLAEYTFYTYIGQLGTDRTTAGAGAVEFSPERGNLESETLDEDRMGEGNAAIVLGMGERSTRTVVVRESTAGADSAWNDIELMASAADNEFEYMLNAAGDAALAEASAREKFEGQPMQVESSVYGLHWFLGDKVYVRYGTDVFTKKIMGISVSVSDIGAEKLDIQWEDVAR